MNCSPPPVRYWCSQRPATLQQLPVFTPIGSAVFAIPPGCEPGGWVGRTLLG
ncbi:hypothetical protein AB0H83_21775 [Dactylosporangium sp. NPDC050688]|uniref:hypothetical protein n=1 Tax=Dactylosporangium sp. NPDC050688 TaxID=3157217 RepID=UPI0033C16460